MYPIEIDVESAVTGSSEYEIIIHAKDSTELATPNLK